MGGRRGRYGGRSYAGVSSRPGRVGRGTTRTKVLVALESLATPAMNARSRGHERMIANVQQISTWLSG